MPKDVAAKTPAVCSTVTGLTIWLTGLSGSGKSTLARALEHRLGTLAMPVEVLDGDEVRAVLSPDLGYTRPERDTHVRRLGYVARLLERHGVVVIVAAISPFRSAREAVRRESRRFVEIHCACPLAEAERRDVKGLYKRARRGEITNFTGITAPYEEPIDPEIVVNICSETVDESLDRVWAILCQGGYITNQRTRGTINPQLIP